MGSAMKTVHDVSLLGGHPVLDFVNTVDSRVGRLGTDYLTGYGDLLVWARRTGVVDPQALRRLEEAVAQQPAMAEVALKRAIQLREAIFGLCLAEGGVGASDADLDILNEMVLRAGRNRRIVATEDGLAWHWAETLDLVADRVAVAAAELLLGARNRRPIRQCPGDNCGWLFLDTSRGGRRHWCSDRTCGTKARVRRFRAA
jgi:predicted RNA-binding Zn ribbon-like protein